MNFAAYLQKQKQEDRQAFIIHYPAVSAKSQFARKVCQSLPQIYYLDLLEYVFTNPELAPIEKMDCRQLQAILLRVDQTLPEQKTSVLVDQVDFLLNTWSAEEKKELIQWLRMPLRTPSVTKRTFIFLIQTDDVLSSAVLTDSRNQSRIHPLNAFDTL
ncbi:MAG: hypothetical protein WCG34_03570 [Leptolinea sp.]